MRSGALASREQRVAARLWMPIFRATVRRRTSLTVEAQFSAYCAVRNPSSASMVMTVCEVPRERVMTASVLWLRRP